MNTALVERKENGTAPMVTAEQVALVKNTVAAGATDAELKLYLFDCARQGVHPLDRLIHFTKRGGKYTPITSIDFMRIRAAESGEYAGSDAALYAGTEGVWSSLWTSADPPFAAMVTVWRLVQGTRCKFEAVARWQEYKPADNDFMWKKLPATMLAKCAEALALRKGFPRQLAGLYAKEELDQAGPSGGYAVDAHGHQPTIEAQASAPVEERGRAASGASRTDGDAPSQATPRPPQRSEEAHQLTITSVKMQPTKNVNVRKHVLVLSDGRQVTTIKDQLGALAEQCVQEGCAVTVETKTTRWGEDLTALHRVQMSVAGADGHENHIDDDPDLSF